MQIRASIRGSVASTSADALRTESSEARSSRTNVACTSLPSFSASQDDCNDENPDIHPNATEICNGIDDNCNNDIDDNPQTTNIFYRDGDGDGFGDENNTISQCSLPDGFVSILGDCNDDNINISPDASEICNGIDDNCDTEVDNDSTDAGTWYRDNDGDGFACSWNPEIYRKIIAKTLDE